MKKKLLIGTTLSVCLLTFAMAGVLLTNNKEANEVNAYSSASLPTTIDLNDCDEDEIRNYYSSLSSLDESDRQGTNLLKNLKNILKNGQKYYGYDSNLGDKIWQMYEITDRDWEKSPASSTTYGTYDSTTNTITGYTYGSSASNSKNNPYIHALYVNRDVTNQVRAWGNHNQDQWGINREHVWPKAEGFDGSGAGGARGDPMHLMAGNGYANNIHSNNYYGYVDTSKSYTDCGATHTTKTGTYTWPNLSGNLSGTALNVSTPGSQVVFEPQDSDKGDIARAIFYMVARYNYLGGNDTIDSNNPNLTLTNSLADWASSGYTSTTSNPGKLGVLRDLLAWHKADPVDEFEIHRNNLLYRNYTSNRNPFIDFPEWADYIWGTVEYSGHTYISSNTTPTGYAKPSLDVVNGYNEETGDNNPRVLSVSVSPSSSTIDLNTSTLTQQLTATVEVANDATKTVTWSSNNTSIATVSSTGLVTAVSTGSCTITATSTFDNTKTGSATIKVINTEELGPESLTEFTWDLITNSYDDNPTADLVTWSHTVATMQAIRTSSARNAVNSYLGGDQTTTRFYTGNTLKFTPSTDYEISSVEITTATNNFASAIANASYTNAVASSEGKLATIVPTNGKIEFSLVPSAYFGVTSVKVNYVYHDSSAIGGIVASVSKDFAVGEKITKSDITLKDELDNIITDFEFSDYTFVYEDAPTGGDAFDEKDFDIEYDGYETTLAVSVYRNKTAIVSDVLNRDVTGITGTSYTDFSGKTSNSDAVYAGQCSGGNSSIQLRTDNNNSGIVSTASGGIFRSVTVEWNSNTADGRTLNVYGKNTAYSSATDLYETSTQGTLLGTIVKGTSTSLIISGNYQFIGMRSNSKAMYLTSITITYHETAASLADYIMYEDTENQCTTKLDIAANYYSHLTQDDRNTFMTSDSYIIQTARTRLQAWVAHEGKVLSESGIMNGRYVTANLYKGETSNSISMFTVVLGVTSVLAISSYLIIRKKSKEQ